MAKWQLILNILILQELLNRDEPDLSGSVLLERSEDEIVEIYNRLCNDWTSSKVKVDSISGELY